MNAEAYEKYKYLEDLKPYKGAGKYSKLTNTVETYLKKYFKGGSKATYFKDGMIQCQPNKSRSFYDLYFLAKARFKDVSEEEVAYYLLEMTRPVVTDVKLKYIPCGDVQKVTFFIHTAHGGYGSYYTNRMEDNYCDVRYNDEYSFNDLIKLANNYKK